MPNLCYVAVCGVGFCLVSVETREVLLCGCCWSDPLVMTQHAYSTLGIYQFICVQRCILVWKKGLSPFMLYFALFAVSVLNKLYHEVVVFPFLHGFDTCVKRATAVLYHTVVVLHAVTQLLFSCLEGGVYFHPTCTPSQQEVKFSVIPASTYV